MLTKSNFKCKRCGKCCLTYTIKLNSNDLKRLEKAGLKKGDFAEPDDYDISFGKYALKRDENGCILLEKKDNQYSCKFYDSRPDICRKYPFNEKDAVDSCKPQANFLIKK
jgi:uncharacterized protein